MPLMRHTLKAIRRRIRGKPGLGIALLFLGCWVPPVLAAELYENYTSVRAMGMGNAFTSVVDSEEALMYNPAALCRISGINLTLVNPTIGAEGVAISDSVKDLSAAKTKSATADALRQFFGQRAAVQLGFLPVFSVPCIGVGVLGNFQFNAVLRNPAYPNLQTRLIADAGPAFGFGIPLIPKVFYVGLTTRYLYRVGADFPVGMSTIASLSSDALREQITNQGYGFASDLGALVKVPGPVSPTLGVAWRNMGMTEFVKASGTRAPPRNPQEIAVGANINLDAYIVRLTPSVEVKHLTTEPVQLGKKLHAGVELALPIVSARAGLHQGYYTLGAGINLGLIRVDAATWGVEMGEYPGQDESRRYAIQAVVDLSFDADFSFDFKFNLNRKVKQRR